MWKSLRFLRIDKFKSFSQFMGAMILCIFSGYSITAESTSTCWVHNGSAHPPGSSGFRGFNLDGQSWPDPATALRAVQEAVLGVYSGYTCWVWQDWRYVPKGTISQLEAGAIIPTQHTPSDPNDPSTNIAIGYGQMISLKNAAGDFCTGGGIGVIDGSYWNFPQCRQRYIVKLSPLTGVAESGATLVSVEPGRTTESLVAKVYDQNGLVVPNAKVKLVVDVQRYSGGHQHDNDRNTEQMGTLAPMPPSIGTVTLNGKILEGNTKQDGLRFSFTAPAPAGDHKITATCTDGKNCTPEGADTVWVGVKGLEPIILASDPASGPLYVLIGQDNYHPNNHYLTPQANGRLQQLASLYRQRFPIDPPLHLNDASLERGGLFDIYYNYTDASGVQHERNAEGWWIPPHEEHRKGTVIDVRANQAAGAVPSRSHQILMDLARDIGLDAGLHSPGTANQHFHIRLMGAAE